MTCDFRVVAAAWSSNNGDGDSELEAGKSTEAFGLSDDENRSHNMTEVLRVDDSDGGSFVAILVGGIPPTRQNGDLGKKVPWVWFCLRVTKDWRLALPHTMQHTQSEISQIFCGEDIEGKGFSESGNPRKSTVAHEIRLWL